MRVSEIHVKQIRVNQGLGVPYDFLLVCGPLTVTHQECMYIVCT
jgi:hypothetical protein